jgi:hypothetical protein
VTKYYVLLTIPVPETNFFIEIGLFYFILFHPNLTDEITVANYPSKIDEIYYSLDDLTYITIKATATDNLISIHHNPPREVIHKWLSDEWASLKEWAESNNERIILNDWYMHPEKPYDKEYDDNMLKKN